MYRILVLKNRLDVDILDDCNDAVEYFKKRKINISFDFKDIDEPVSCHYYLVANDGNRYYGIDDNVKDSCDKYVEKGKYHTVILAWNTKDVPTPTDGQLTSWTNWSPLTWAKADTEFIQLITNDFNNIAKWIYKSIIHEIKHTFCKRLNRRGLNVVDEMDLTIMPDGTKIPYYKNDDPDAVDGNFAQTLENIKPYLDKLYDFYFIDQENNKPLKLGDKGERVKQLQRDLKAVGYFKYPFITGTFGSITKASVRALQQATGVVVDGIAGKNTLQKIKDLLELKKKPSLIEALIQVESNGNDYAIGDVKLKNKAYGCLQIRQLVCDDVNKKFGTHRIAMEMLGNRNLSIDTFNKYISIYEPNGTDEEKSRCWNAGPKWRKNKKFTDGYWQKVSKVLYN